MTNQRKRQGLSEQIGVKAFGDALADRARGDVTTVGANQELEMIGQALSFALIRHGLDPLHATVVTAGGNGVAFLGRSGYGKSTLAAAFIGAGHRLLTDDLLVLTDGEAGLAAHPGPPRLKLYPEAARQLLPDATGVLMMPGTPKRLFPLTTQHVAPGPVPLRAMYVIVPPGPRTAVARGVRIRRLGARDACLALIRNTFNSSVLDADRLARQLALSARVAAAVPVKSLSYPRSFRAMPAVPEAILADLAAEAAS